MGVIGSLLLRIGCDTSDVDRGFRKSRKSVYSFQKDVMLSSRQLLGLGKGTIGIAAIAMATRRAAAVMKDWMNTAAEMDLALGRLNAAMRFSGATESQVAQIDKAADSLVYLSTETRAAVYEQMAFGKSMGLSANQLIDFTKASIGLSHALNVDLQTAGIALVAAMQGNIQRLRQYGIKVDETTTKQEILTQVLRKAALGFNTASAETETLSGELTQNKKHVDDLKAALGRAISPEYVERVKDLLGTINLLSLSFRGFGEIIGDQLGPFRDFVDAAERLSGLKLFPDAENVAKGVERIKRFLPSPFFGTGGALLHGLRLTHEDLIPAIRERVASKKTDSSFTPGETATAALNAFYGTTGEQFDTINEVAPEIENLSDESEHFEKLLRRQLDDMRAQADVVPEFGQSWEAAERKARLYAMSVKAGGADLEKIAQLQREIDAESAKLEFAEKWRQAGESISSSFESAFDTLLYEGGKFKDFMKQIAADIVKEFIKVQFIKPAADAFGNLFSAGAGALSHIMPSVHHTGYFGGTRAVPAMAFAGAPRLHGGIGPDEYPAILKRGESVIPEGGPSTTVNIINQSGTSLRGRTTGTQISGKRIITSVILEDLQSNGEISQALGR